MAVRVLVVEDERRLAAAVRRGLSAEGFAVDIAYDGEDGLHSAREGDYDAVVLDLMLPKISGYRVCQQLRAEKNWARPAPAGVGVADQQADGERGGNSGQQHQVRGTERPELDPFGGDDVEWPGRRADGCHERSPAR